MKHNETHTMKCSRDRRAEELVNAGAVILPDLPVRQILDDLLYNHGAIPVRSQTDPDKVYMTNGSCQCEDFIRHGEGWRCKHRRAAKRALLARADDEYWRDLLGEMANVEPGDHRGHDRWTREERLARQDEEWCAKNCGRNEVVMFHGGEVIRLADENA